MFPSIHDAVISAIRSRDYAVSFTITQRLHKTDAHVFSLIAKSEIKEVNHEILWSFWPLIQSTLILIFRIFLMFLLTFWALLLVFLRLKIDIKVHIMDRCFWFMSARLGIFWLSHDLNSFGSARENAFSGTSWGTHINAIIHVPTLQLYILQYG